MTREEASRIINECKDKGFKHTFYTLNEYHTALDMAIQALEQEPKWIPVSERLPLLGVHGISNDVLITNGFEIDMGYLVKRGGKIFWHYYGSEYEFGIKDDDNDAIAWMPLPEPYREDGESE